MDIASLALPPYLRACKTGDWVIFLDLWGDRYWALSAKMTSQEMQAALAARGLLARSSDRAAKRMRTPGRKTLGGRFLSDSVLIGLCGLWAEVIVRRGALYSAFTWIEHFKPSSRSAQPRDITVLHDSFRRLRRWLPWSYVCLFNSLCLARFLIERGCCVDLVFGVRGRPFAAHCWVEAGGVVLDDGGEDCAAFTEIARA